VALEGLTQVPGGYAALTGQRGAASRFGWRPPARGRPFRPVLRVRRQLGWPQHEDASWTIVAWR